VARRAIDCDPVERRELVYEVRECSTQRLLEVEAHRAGVLAEDVQGSERSDNLVGGGAAAAQVGDQLTNSPPVFVKQCGNNTALAVPAEEPVRDEVAGAMVVAVVGQDLSRSHCTVQPYMPILRLIEGGPARFIDAYDPAPFELDLDQLRPGLAHEPLMLVLDDAIARLAESRAAADGLATPLWSVLAVESERALRDAAAAIGWQPGELADQLDGTAAAGGTPGVVQRRRRLGRYAMALRQSERRQCAPASSRLLLAVPYHSLLAWELAAMAEGESTEAWAINRLEALPTGRGWWEAAAATDGQTLAEWIGLQAARLSSC